MDPNGSQTKRRMIGMRIRIKRLFIEVAWTKLPKDIDLSGYVAQEGAYEDVSS